MPIITVFPDVMRAYNRVEVDWSDQPSVDYARVLRVDVETGECTPLRPYICFSGDYLNVSCDGHGIFWDTEVPLDRSVYYITEALAGAPCVPEDPLVFDTFNRLLTDSWGSPDIGPGPYLLQGGTSPGNYDVNGSQGTQTLDTTVASRRSTLDVGTPNAEQTVIAYSPALATGNPYRATIMGRYTDANNFYFAELAFDTTGFIDVSLRKNVAGVFSTLVSELNFVTYDPAEGHYIKFSHFGSTLKMKTWEDGSSEPTDWLLTATDTDLVTGNRVGLRSVADAGNTNGTLVIPFDNYVVSRPCEPCTPVTASTVDTPTTMPSNGAFRLKDPVRPCNDLYVPLCFDQVSSPECLPGSGVFFGSMEDEIYDSNTLVLNPTNASTPLAVSRNRRKKSSLLTLVTRTFTDRDNLLKINEPGTPLLWQGPPEYGIKDAYLSIGSISIRRGVTDHKYPVRINDLPFTEVVRPAGPSLGVCGSQVQDTCDIFDTWQGLVDEGFTYEDLVRGVASTDGPVGPRIRNWDEVEAEFADWDAVEANGTWADLEAGN
jgi:hypothetical protein